jgi:hypothetical protein
MSEMEISEKTLKKIEEKNIKPEPKWHFVSRDVSLALFLVFSVFSGVAASSLIIYLLQDHDWEAEKFLNTDFIHRYILFIPYFWIVLFLFFMAVSFLAFRHIKQGYRYAGRLVVGAEVAIFLILGFALFDAGADMKIHERLLGLPVYDSLVHTKEDDWYRIDKGLLAGEVVDITSTDDFKVKDKTGYVWEVRGGSGGPSVAILPVKDGDRIKIIGVRGDDNIFFIKSIRPWK